MPSRLLFIGLDAFPASRVDRWMERSRASTLVALAREGRQVQLASHVAWMPGSIWPEINTGVSVARSGLYYHPGQIRSGEAHARPIEPRELRIPGYWETASDAGLRVCVIDPVQGVPREPFNGLQIIEWGTHDRHFETESRPAALLAELEGRHGAHPVDSCNRINAGGRGSERLRELLLQGIERKLAVCRELLAREQWDLFSVTFSEGHCAGHQLWPLGVSGVDVTGDEGFERLDSVAHALDEAVARLLDAARADKALIVASHGMASASKAEHLLPEVLDHLGLGFGRRGRVRAAGLVPASVRSVIRRLVGSSTIERMQLGVESRVGHFTGRSSAVAMHNGATGAIRLSIAGREPGGLLEPGAQVEEIVATLGRELEALRCAETGEPVVEEVAAADQVFGADRHPDLPDLLVRFRPRATRVSSLVSPHGWSVSQPRGGGRTGEHVADSRLWTVGGRVAAGQSPDAPDVLDVAPTIVNLLGLEPGERYDGKALTFG